MSGWIKLHRSITDNQLYFKEPFNKTLAWIDLLLLANHKDDYFFVRGVKVDIKRGQVGWTDENLGKRWTWSRGKVKRYLLFLQKEGQIVLQPSNVTTLISIVKYEEYQVNDTTDRSADRSADGSADGQQIGQQVDVNKNDKNEKNEKNNNRVGKKPTARNEESNAIWYELVNLWITEEDPNILNGPTRKRYFDIMSIEQQQALLDTIKGFGKHVKFLKKTWISVTFKNHNMNEIFLLNEIAREKKAIEKRVGNDSRTYIDGEEDYAGAAARLGIKTIRYDEQGNRTN